MSTRPASPGRSLPQSMEAELSVLGGVLLDNRALDALAEIVVAEDFYRDGHGQIFRCMRSLQDRAEPIDLVTLGEELRRAGALERVGGVAYLSSLLEAVPTAANVAHYGRIVHEKALVRKVIHAATEIAEDGY